MRDYTIDEITKRTQRYFYEDGIWEIGFGLVNFLLAAFFLIASSIDWVGPLALVIALLQMGVVVGSYLLINRVVRYLKERITYPRTGYVSYRKPAARARLKRIGITALISCSLAALVSIIATIRMMENAMPLVIGIMMAAALVYLGVRLNFLRLYFIAGFVLVLGYLLSLVSLPSMKSTSVFFGGLGLLLIVSGGLTLLDYMRRTRPADESMDYEPTDEGPDES